jgi:menaquinone-dependent protoporphyrinogen oxidase
MRNQISRREFVEIAAVSFGAIALKCSGAHLLDVRAAEKAEPVPPHKASVPSGGKILVAYATRCGSTAEIAEALGKDLQLRGYKPEIAPVGKISDVSAYQAVLLGSAVREGDWLSEAQGFVRHHQREIQNLPNAFFTVHMMNVGDDEKSRKGRLAYLNPIRKLVQPDTEAFFAGRMDLNRLSFGERLLCKALGSKTEDLRNWPVIHAWGSNVFKSEVRS